jgi:hypothetical protein
MPVKRRAVRLFSLVRPAASPGYGTIRGPPGSRNMLSATRRIEWNRAVREFHGFIYFVGLPLRLPGRDQDWRTAFRWTPGSVQITSNRFTVAGSCVFFPSTQPVGCTAASFLSTGRQFRQSFGRHGIVDGFPAVFGIAPQKNSVIGIGRFQKLGNDP